MNFDEIESILCELAWREIHDPAVAYGIVMAWFEIKQYTHEAKGDEKG